MRKKAITGFGVMLLCILLLAIFFFLNFNTVVVTGPSMEETFHGGDRLLASRAYWLIGPVRKKDIVVVRTEDGKGYLIKRVYRMGGERVDAKNVPADWSLANGEYPVPAGSIYVLGDNRRVSEDSRKFGPVSTDRILGKVVILKPSWIAGLGVIGSVFVVGLLVLTVMTAIADAKRRAAPPTA